MNFVIIDSDNGLSPLQCQSINQTNADILSIRHLGTNFSEVGSQNTNVVFRKMHLNMLSLKLPLCSGPKMLTLFLSGIDKRINSFILFPLHKNVQEHNTKIFQIQLSQSLLRPFIRSRTFFTSNSRCTVIKNVQIQQSHVQYHREVRYSVIAYYPWKYWN